MMNQVRIGAFISKRRKAMGLTQSQLAEKLGITDKAVSKWETGRSMPDLSLFMPLCALFGITLNELFAGECIAQENLREKADEILLEVITNWLGHDTWEEKEDAAPQIVLEVENVSKRYGNDQETPAGGNSSVSAVKDVSFQVARGSFVGIMGASGCGKTTLLNLIATIDQPTSGNIWIGGQNIVELSDEDTAQFRRGHLGFVFQEYNLLDNHTIYENIALALTIKEIPKERIRPVIEELAEKLAILSILDRFPHEVSGGQRQRCACARAIIADPDIILADEPTGALDSLAARQLLDTFSLLCRECGATILMVTHDAMAASCCERVLFMKDGEIKASLTRGQENRQAFFAEILKKLEQMESV